MKRYCIILFIIMAACETPNPEGKAQDVFITNGEVTTAVLPDTMCFILTEGLKNQDTQAVKLIFSKNQVSGKMVYMPAEKDWRFGNLNGVKESNVLKLTWVYVQEGMKDSVRTVFKLEDDGLLQKPFNYDVVTGKEFVADTSQFTRKYQKVDCSSFPKQDFDLGI